MAGRIVNVIPPRLLDCTNLAVSQSLTIVLKRGIDVSEWMSAAMMVRVNAMSVTGGTITVLAQYEGVSPDDPGRTFVSAIPEHLGVTIDLNSPDPPSFEVSKIGGSLGAGLRVIAIAQRYNSDPFHATFSVDLKLTNHYYAPPTP